MSGQSPLRVAGALLVLAVAIVSTGIIAMGFLAPEQLFDGPSAYAFFAAVIAMTICAVIANLYDLRGIIVDAF